MSLRLLSLSRDEEGTSPNLTGFDASFMPVSAEAEEGWSLQNASESRSGFDDSEC